MSSKQFASDGDIVLPAMRGLARSSPWVSIIESERVVFRTDSASGTEYNKNHVSLVALGGAGHEGLNGGYVGDGLLSAAASGTLFSSPSSKQISAALSQVNSPKGNLVILMNYTGDVIHSGLSVERAKAQGAQVEVVIVGDDVAVGREQGGLVGRRGLAGTVLVHKIAGAAAAEGLELKAVADIARSVGSNCVTIGASLDHCNVPGRQFETNLKTDEYEVGMGIHNEAGVKKNSPIPSIPQLVSELLPLLLDQNDKDRAFVPFDAKNDDVVLVVNNLGGISNLEMNYATEVVHEQLQKDYGIVPVRTATGAFITALNGPGFSITLLNASRAGKDTLKYFDAPARASAWNQGSFTSEWAATKGQVSTVPASSHDKVNEKSSVSADAKLFESMLKSGIESVLKEEPRITEYDTVAGDGDCGETLNNGGTALLNAIKDGKLRLDDGVNGLADIAEIVEDSMGGTSGGLYSIYLNALANGVRESGETSLNIAAFAKATQYALDNLYQYTKARAGDRTLIDALAPFVETLREKNDFGAAVDAAIEGGNSTRKLEAKFGRATYVDREALKHYDNEGGLPDPGAIGLGALLSGFLSGYKV